MRDLVLIYHDVVPKTERRSSGFDMPGADHYKLDPELFERHLDAMEGHEVTLTFDDGGASALTGAAPALERRGRRGIFFVTTARLGTPGFLDAEGVRALRAAGHEIGSHGHTHAHLTTIGPDAVDDEWRRSKHLLEEILGEPVTAASVPGGFYSREVARRAFAAGYRVLYNSEPSVRERRVEGGVVRGRFSIVEDTPPGKVAALCRRSRPAILREAASWQARKAAKAVLGPVYPRLRAAILERGPG